MDTKWPPTSTPARVRAVMFMTTNCRTHPSSTVRAAGRFDERLPRPSVPDHLHEQPVRVRDMQPRTVSAVDGHRPSRSKIRDNAILVEALNPDGEVIEAGRCALTDRKMGVLAHL